MAREGSCALDQGQTSARRRWRSTGCRDGSDANGRPARSEMPPAARRRRPLWDAESVGADPWKEGGGPWAVEQGQGRPAQPLGGRMPGGRMAGCSIETGGRGPGGALGLEQTVHRRGRYPFFSSTSFFALAGIFRSHLPAW